MSIITIKRYEVIEIINKEVSMSLEVNYDKQTMALVHQEGNGFKPKAFIFTNRTASYLKGWKNIFETMQMAAEIGAKLLNESMDHREAARAQRVAEMIAEKNHENQN